MRFFVLSVIASALPATLAVSGLSDSCSDCFIDPNRYWYLQCRGCKYEYPADHVGYSNCQRDSDQDKWQCTDSLTSLDLNGCVVNNGNKLEYRPEYVSSSPQCIYTGLWRLADANHFSYLQFSGGFANSCDHDSIKVDGHTLSATCGGKDLSTDLGKAGIVHRSF
ncbi:hypothetical protein NUU61_006241 [Penicillium alfredii]|uniref:Cyanovirin-N domain-containing protein n=1 Tax=Penicillium alfredii TaxID=1506179 RepID=A0A9W9F0R0_9EURO|nr:uncharacterized protein NUU61_006241 [Penicillium alfredii]KAJ5091371.1 hypothetical protein NUU61_006241 [Penicillium alfredii]